MRRLISLIATAALTVWTAASCAHNPGSEPASTQPVPDARGISNWLELQGDAPLDRPGFFIQMADPQLGLSEYPLLLALFGATWKDDIFETDARLFERAIAHANELEPAFVIICGDLINRVGHPGQIAEFQRIASLLDASIPLYLVAGNHDVENEPTEESLTAYRESFGADWYSFREGGVYGIVLNSQLIDAPDEVPEEAERQLEWLREELAQAGFAGEQNILVFQHQAYFIKTPDEPSEYFNIDRGSRAIYLELLKEAGVEAVFAGHYHRNAYGRDGELEMVTTGPVGRPLGDDPSGFRIVEIGENSIHHEYFELREP
jgi:3',5'-cyclic AMP phosphodiesterase CpdA